MANAIRSRTVQKGIDPREYALVAFGGAGPLHGADVAAMLGISEVIVPPYPGITSAMGLLTTDIKYESLRTVFLVSPTSISSGSIAIWRQCVLRSRSNSVPTASISARSNSTVRPTPAMSGRAMSFASISPDGPIDAAAIRRTFDQFHSVHEAEYGHFFAESPIEIVNVRLTGVAPTPTIRKVSVKEGGSLGEALLKKAAHLLPARRAPRTDGDGVLSARTAAGRQPR